MQRVRSGSIDLNVAISGEGSPLLLVHGFPLDHTMWRQQIQGLTGVRCIAPDLPGFGGSEVRPSVTMEQMADDLAGLLDALGIDGPIAFCGLSMGGYVAWQFWRRHRQRLGKLILCDTKAAADTGMAARGRRTNARRVLEEGTEFLADSMSDKLFSEHTRTTNPQCIAEVQRVIRATSPAGVAAALIGMADRQDATGWLPEVAVPTLAICGAEDPLSPVREMQAIVAALPQARLVVVPRAGHMAPLENPEPVNQALQEFLS